MNQTETQHFRRLAHTPDDKFIGFRDVPYDTRDGERIYSTQFIDAELSRDIAKCVRSVGRKALADEGLTID